MRLCGVSDHEHLSQVSSFLHLVPQGLFLTVCGHTPTTWDFKVGPGVWAAVHGVQHGKGCR